MNWSPNIRSSAGTNITLQIAFLVLLAWIGIADDPAGGPAGAFASMAFILLVFVGVTKPEKPVHELFEAIAAPLINAGSALALMAVFGLGSLLWNPILMFVGIFIYFAARAEEHQAAVSGYAYRLTVRDAMEHSPGVLDEGQPLSEAAEGVTGGGRHRPHHRRAHGGKRSRNDAGGEPEAGEAFAKAKSWG